MEYIELKKQIEQLQMLIEQERRNPTSEYDESITKQQYFNETMKTQVIRIFHENQNLISIIYFFNIFTT